MRKAAAIAALMAAAYFLLFGGEYTFLDLWRIDREYDREVAELEAIKVDVAELEATADSLASDSAALERLAREQYGLIREGERLYRFVEDDSGGLEPRRTPEPEPEDKER